MIRHSLIVLAALPFLLVACDGGGDPVEQAVREAATVNQAATVTAGEVSGPRSGDHGTAGNQAFAASEAEMSSNVPPRSLSITPCICQGVVEHAGM